MTQACFCPWPNICTPTMFHPYGVQEPLHLGLYTYFTHAIMPSNQQNVCIECLT